MGIFWNTGDLNIAYGYCLSYVKADQIATSCSLHDPETICPRPPHNLTLHSPNKGYPSWELCFSTCCSSFSHEIASIVYISFKV
ncbi:hypothetical protein K2173_027190 [Erythroxylum novogranatense]|uniref:Uncharacterized protein n=1 Tax=Erythroxylum novogranatense TaxID=1862640 RepID=A0AAV8U0Y3_9ROSI|nr:hypothetical protein K2173_027190 [Erythroxylum novogranatense]